MTRIFLTLIFVCFSLVLPGQEIPTDWLIKAQDILKNPAFTAQCPAMVSDLPFLFPLNKPKQTRQWAALAIAKDQAEPFPLLVSFDERGAVRQIWVLEYLAPMGYEVTDPAWLKRFIGKDDQMLTDPKQRVDGITGATLSSRAVVRKVCELSRLIKARLAASTPKGS